jgi:hypothetical protein
MNTEKVTVLNLENGQVGVVRKSLFEHPSFNVGQLVQVPEGQKPYNRHLWTPRTLEQWEDGHRDLDVDTTSYEEDSKAYDEFIKSPESTEEEAD